MDESLNLLDDLDLDLDLDLGISESGESAPSTPTDPMGPMGKGAFFGPYQVIENVGQGGVAKVMRARHIHPGYADQTFAIKVLHEELSRDPRVVAFFRSEAYVLAMLKHPSIVQTFEAGTQDDKIYIAMEYVDGRDLDEMVARCKRFQVPLPMSVALFVIAEVLDALTYAHELNDADGEPLKLVHRDINPANVFLSYDGRVKLGDFGVASLSVDRFEKSRELAGKIGYFAPEQLAGEDVDQRSDIFALGVMMFEVLTGQRLFDGANQGKIMRLNKKAKIPRPSKINPQISPALESVILKALERKPQDRFRSARAMAEALASCTPMRDGLPIAVASLMRMVFLQEHIKELQLREGLSGGGPGRGSGQLVAMCSHDERSQLAFSELLNSRGYEVSCFRDPSSLSEAFKAGYNPDVLVASVGTSGFPRDLLLAVLRDQPDSAPLVAVCESLDERVALESMELGAVDLLSKPFNIERVLTSIRAACSGASKALTPHQTAVANLGSLSRALLVSSDSALLTRLSRGLDSYGYSVDVSPTPDEGIKRCRESSYEVVVVDARGAPERALELVQALRSLPGVGLLPALYLAEEAERASLGDLSSDRARLVGAGLAEAEVAAMLNSLIADTRLGRTFLRYPAQFLLELRFGGRVFSGQAVDVSRRGMMLMCEQLPPVGEQVAVSLNLVSGRRPIAISGTVIRVDMARHTGDRPRIGVSFDKFAGRCERELIAFIARLDQGSEDRQRNTELHYPPSDD